MSSLSLSFASSESSLLASSRLLNRSYLVSFLEAWRSLIISDMYCYIPPLASQTKNEGSETYMKFVKSKLDVFSSLCYAKCFVRYNELQEYVSCDDVEGVFEGNLMSNGQNFVVFP